MSQLNLIHGTFSQQDAQHLLTELIKTKIAFHEHKIRTVHESEEDIKHSEQKIIQLSQNLRNIISELKSQPHSNVNLEATITINRS